MGAPDDPTSTSMCYCPVCWTPFRPLSQDAQEHKCSNAYCPVAAHDFRIFLFRGIDDAHAFAAKSLKEGFRLYSPAAIDAHAAQYQIVGRLKPPLDRFRLIDDGFPLLRLLSKDLIDSWIYGSVKGQRSNLFRIYAIAYERAKGKIQLDDGVPSYQRLGLPYGEGFCAVCTAVREHIDIKCKADPGFADPCKLSTHQLVREVIERLRQSPVKNSVLLETETHAAEGQRPPWCHTCWLGLTSISVPIIVADVLVGIAVLGQKFVTDIPLTVAQKNARKETLQLLGMRCCNRQFRSLRLSLEELRLAYYVPLKEKVHNLATLAYSQYGQLSNAKTHILIDGLREHVRQRGSVDHTSEREAWQDIGPGALKDIGVFFSFRKAMVFHRQENGDMTLECVWPAAALELPSPLTASTPAEARERVLTIAKGNTDHPESTVVIAPETHYLYVFYDRRHANGTPRGTFNEVCKANLSSAVYAFHSAITQLLMVVRNTENILSMAHNTKRPSSLLGNALSHLTAEVYGVHNATTLHVFREHPYLQRSIAVINSAIISATKKLNYEVDKVVYAYDPSFLRKRRKYLPIVGDGRTVTGGPVSLWGRAQESLGLFVGDNALSTLSVDPRQLSHFAEDECVYINPALVQILLDNLFDNAVKYSFERTTISVTLKRISSAGRDGKLRECAELAVSNYGHGIDESERSRIGTKRYRGKYSSTQNRKNQGTGLGVYTIATIVAAIEGTWGWRSHYGREVNVVPGEGWQTTFWVCFPIERHRP